MKKKDDRLFLDNAIEANLLEAVLVQEKISFYLRSYADLAYDGIFHTQKGWGHVEVPDEYRKRVNSLLAEMRKKQESG